MCTGVGFEGKRFFFGRNMDIEGSFGEEIVLVPRRFPLDFCRIAKLEAHYAVLGMAAVMDGYPLYADGMNEFGLCMAGLNFVGNAYYHSPEIYGERMLAPYELIPYILATCKNCEEARLALEGACLVNVPFRRDVPLSELHWIVADGEGCLVIESTKSGFHVYDNPSGVLTNNPPFPHQLENSRLYRHLTESDPSTNSFFSLGLGAVGLPGDYSSPSRFVRASYLREAVMRHGHVDLSTVYRILGAVAPPFGSVLDRNNQPHYTTYSCCMDPVSRRYTYNTHENHRITTISMDEWDLSCGGLHRISIRRSEDLLRETCPS